MKGYFCLLSLIVFVACCFTPVHLNKTNSNCKCWLKWYKRQPCNGKKHTPQDQCEAAGCCYHEHAMASPSCYKPSGSCPDEQCMINLDERELCYKDKVSNRLMIPQPACEHAGCCYNAGFEPKCYQPKEGSVKPTVWSKYTTVDPLHHVPYLEPKYESIAFIKMKKECHDYFRSSCGNDDTTRSQCIRFGCCWDPLRGQQGINPCFKAKRFITSLGENEVDLMLLIDGSGSIGRDNFLLIRDWIKSFTSKIDLSTVQIGVVQFSTFIQTIINLGQYKDQAQFDAAIDGMQYYGGGTPTGSTIVKTIQEDFKNPAEVRPGARRIMLLVTDGQSNFPSLLPIAIQTAKQNAVNIFGYGVGDYVNIAELTFITQSPTKVFLEQFSDLDKQNARIRQAMKI